MNANNYLLHVKERNGIQRLHEHEWLSEKHWNDSIYCNTVVQAEMSFEGSPETVIARRQVSSYCLVEQKSTLLQKSFATVFRVKKLVIEMNFSTLSSFWLF